MIQVKQYYIMENHGLANFMGTHNAYICLRGEIRKLLISMYMNDFLSGNNLNFYSATLLP